jgi:hypothetical protein
MTQRRAERHQGYREGGALGGSVLRAFSSALLRVLRVCVLTRCVQDEVRQPCEPPHGDCGTVQRSGSGVDGQMGEGPQFSHDCKGPSAALGAGKLHDATPRDLRQREASQAAACPSGGSAALLRQDEAEKLIWEILQLKRGSASTCLA